jgi:hypothetical protein
MLIQLIKYKIIKHFYLCYILPNLNIKYIIYLLFID